MSQRMIRIQAHLLLTIALAASLQAQARPAVTSPQTQFGHDIGADYVLPDYTALMGYWQKLARESDRMVLDTIGITAEGRPQLMAIVTSPANHAKRDRFKEIARRLALADGLSEDEARQLAAEGKAVVWIDGGLHATEVLGAQQLMELVYQMVSGTDAETMRILNDVIILAVHANPDGMELVSDWYMRVKVPTKRSTAGIPRLYQKYIGHDNNRDFYMVTQPETENMARVMYREWFPQIVYNHHQTGPSGTVLFAPPFRDPFNYFYDPLVVTGIDLVGAAMHRRFVAENKPGATTRRGANYSTWWNGGLRTTVYFHNMIGLLTETIGNPTPIEIPFLPNRQLASNDLVYPVPPQQWRFRQSVDYSITANRAVLDLASRHREQLLLDIYRMGRNSIERGSRDHWTVTPSDIERVREKARQGNVADGSSAPRPDVQVGGGIRERGLPLELWQTLHDPAERDPRGYVLRSNQPDFATATKFVNALIKTGITVHRATAPFRLNGKQYPEGSYVVRTAQAFRPHVLDMFEPQDHPNDFQYQGGPPIPPYDNAGWTLAYQMGIQFDRILGEIEGPLQPIEGEARPQAGTVTSLPNAAGYLLSHRVNDAALAVNQLLEGGHEVHWTAGGTYYIAARSSTRPVLERMARELGLSFEAVRERPAGPSRRMRQPRVGLWDQYGGSMPSGWVRWLLERYAFPFEVVYPPQLDAGNLRQKYDVLIFVDGAIPARDGQSQGGFGGGTLDTATVPDEWRARMGRVTVAKTVPQLRAFLESGGTILTIGSSTNLAYHLGLPITNALVETAGDSTRPLPRDKYYVPGSVLEIRVDSTLAIAHGMGGRADVFFDESPAFRLTDDAAQRGVRRVAWFDSATPLRSGWAWGQQYLENTTAVAEARVGRGTLYLFGPEITFRAQPHGTFKLLFNGIFLGGAAPQGGG
ncbi:MAG TPA: M14 metallopeptidase family protein [Gemmatimonadaceae bacterium]|nr:M14 metallopeptidase family protein [Gemmatimonadaceae bacterium]